MHILTIKPKLKLDIAVKRVAAYIRVSYLDEHTSHSLERQREYFKALIAGNPEWSSAGIFCDSGKSGTGIDKRNGFKAMIAECEAGRVDMVITKSISRFARNTVDLLKAIRRLRELGIAVWFEKERINTLTSTGELMITLLASYAEEEVMSISQNVKWGIQKRFKEGRPQCCQRVFGYVWDEDKAGYVIKEDESAIVRKMYDDFLSGMSPYQICKRLKADGITTVRGKYASTGNLLRMLSSEFYLGRLVLQKTFVADSLTHKRETNNGELPKYVVDDDHEAIIDDETFQRAQELIRKRQELGLKKRANLNIYPFTQMVVCGKCGSYYHRHVGHKESSEKTTWICGTHRRSARKCRNRNVPEWVLMEKSAEALGLKEFDAETFKENIDHVVANEDDSLAFCFKDGRVTVTKWKGIRKCAQSRKYQRR